MTKEQIRRWITKRYPYLGPNDVNKVADSIVDMCEGSSVKASDILTAMNAVADNNEKRTDEIIDEFGKKIANKIVQNSKKTAEKAAEKTAKKVARQVAQDTLKSNKRP